MLGLSGVIWGRAHAADARTDFRRGFDFAQEYYTSPRAERAQVVRDLERTREQVIIKRHAAYGLGE